MARRKKEDGFELAWQGLVVLPALLVFWLGFRASHSFETGAIYGVVVAVLGIGIIIAYRVVQRQKLKRSGIFDVDKMSGRDFENNLGHLFRRQGYDVTVTRESGDYGADLILHKDDSKVVVQAKRHEKNVGIKAVQEVQASIAHYKAQQGWVVTNSGFTAAAVNLAKSNGITLIGRKELINLMLAMRDKNNSKKQSASVSDR